MFEGGQIRRPKKKANLINDRRMRSSTDEYNEWDAIDDSTSRCQQQYNSFSHCYDSFL